MNKLVLALVTILAMLAASGAGCGEAPGITTGTLALYLANAPTDAENITGVCITINEIQYHMDDQWITCEEFVGPKTYDLLELTDGNSTLLGELVLPGGHYNQIRFILDAPEMGQDPINPGCYIEFADNSTEPLFVRSGNTTGFKAVGEFTVPINGTVEITTDFDQIFLPVPALLLLGPTASGKTPLGDAVAARGLLGFRAHHLDFGAELRAIAEGSGRVMNTPGASLSSSKECSNTGFCSRTNTSRWRRRSSDSFSAGARSGPLTCSS